jgi:hypothetical protein
MGRIAMLLVVIGVSATLPTVKADAATEPAGRPLSHRRAPSTTSSRSTTSRTG